jgi:hypothetical protein
MSALKKRPERNCAEAVIPAWAVIPACPAALGRVAGHADGKGNRS